MFLLVVGRLMKPLEICMDRDCRCRKPQGGACKIISSWSRWVRSIRKRRWHWQWKDDSRCRFQGSCWIHASGSGSQAI